MNYGHFDDAHCEYVITRPDTPYPWINYLGSEAVAEMNELAARSVFVPIGIDKYWDNNHTVFTGLRSNEPVVTFLTIAEEQVQSGFESTMSN